VGPRPGWGRGQRWAVTGGLQHACAPLGTAGGTAPCQAQLSVSPIPPTHLLVQAEVGTRPISMSHPPSPPPPCPEPGSQPPAAKGLRGPRASGTQRLEQTRVLAVGSGPREAAKPSSAKGVGVSPRQQPGRGLDMAPSRRPVTPPRSPSPHLAWGSQRGGRGGWRHGGGPRAEPHKAGQDVPRLRTATGTKGVTLGRTVPARSTNPPQPRHCSPSLSQLPTCSQSPDSTQGGRRGHPVSPHPPPAPRECCEAEPAPRRGSPGGCCCPRGPRHFWSASASLRREGRG